jgi:hypothetical protein
MPRVEACDGARCSLEVDTNHPGHRIGFEGSVGWILALYFNGDEGATGLVHNGRTSSARDTILGVSSISFDWSNIIEIDALSSGNYHRSTDFLQ